MSFTPVKFSIRNKKAIVCDEPVAKTNPTPIGIHTVTSELGKLTLKTKRSAAYNVFGDAFSKFENEINQLNLGNKKTDDLIKIIRTFSAEQNKFICSVVDLDISNMSVELKSRVQETLTNTNSHVQEKITELSTAYKRKKRLLKYSSLVQPEEIGMGLKWRSNNQPDCDIPNHTIAQTTFQYISIKQTLFSLFQKPSFENGQR